MRIMVAMSGGVDSSVAAALLRDEGHDVVGVTLKLWGGAQDAGCCSVGDVEDARRVAQQLGIDHHVFNFGDEFHAHVVAPYAEAHAAGRTPNPCVECNRHIKFDRLFTRGRQLGFDAIATGHHARIVASGTFELHRGADRAKDQSYVLSMLDQERLAHVRFPVGELTKADVRARANALGLRTADKPESQDTCFITATGGREAFLAERIPLHPGRVVDTAGSTMGMVDAVELVTVGQRRGLGGGGGDRHYALAVDVAARTVVVGPPGRLVDEAVALEDISWIGAAQPAGTAVRAQCSAHGPAELGVYDGSAVVWDRPQRRVAAGQTVVLYDPILGQQVLGGGTAAGRTEAPGIKTAAGRIEALDDGTAAGRTDALRVETASGGAAGGSVATGSVADGVAWHGEG